MRGRTNCTALALAVTAAVAACGDDDGGAGADAGAARGLETLASALAAVPDGAERQDILWGDLARAGDIAGLDRPTDPGDAEAVNDYVMAVTGSLREPAGSATPVAVAPPAAFQFGHGADLGPFVEDVGWSMLQVDRFVEVVTPPDRATGTELATVTVLAGDFDGDELTAAIGDPDDDTWVAGSGTPSELDAGDTTPARPMGESLWLALPDNDLLTVTGDADSSAAVAAVVAGDAGSDRVLADDPALASLAAALDGQGAYAAGLYRPSPGLAGPIAGPYDEACAAGLAQKPAAVAVGIADDDGPVVLVALAHRSGTAAEANAAALERIVSEGASLVSGEAWSENLELDRVEATGDDGTVTLAHLRPVEPRPRIWYDLLTQRENLISACRADA